MDAHPTSVINDAVVSAKPVLSKAGEVMSAVLLERLASDPHYANFEICVRAEIIDPASGDVVGKFELKEPYRVYPDRDPDFRDPTE